MNDRLKEVFDKYASTKIVEGICSDCLCQSSMLCDKPYLSISQFEQALAEIEKEKVVYNCWKDPNYEILESE